MVFWGILFVDGSLFNSRPAVIFPLTAFSTFSNYSPGTEACQKSVVNWTDNICLVGVQWGSVIEYCSTARLVQGLKWMHCNHNFFCYMYVEIRFTTWRNKSYWLSHKCGPERQITREANIQIAVRPVARTASRLLHTVFKILPKFWGAISVAAAQTFSLKSSVVHGQVYPQLTWDESEGNQRENFRFFTKKCTSQ